MATDRYTVIVYMYRLGELYALAGKLFGFARGEEAFDSKKLTWENFRNAFGILDVQLDELFIDDKMNLKAFTERRLARTEGSQEDA